MERLKKAVYVVLVLALIAGTLAVATKAFSNWHAAHKQYIAAQAQPPVKPQPTYQPVYSATQYVLANHGLHFACIQGVNPRTPPQNLLPCTNVYAVVTFRGSGAPTFIKSSHVKSVAWAAGLDPFNKPAWHVSVVFDAKVTKYPIYWVRNDETGQWSGPQLQDHTASNPQVVNAYNILAAGKKTYIFAGTHTGLAYTAGQDIVPESTLQSITAAGQHLPLVKSVS